MEESHATGEERRRPVTLAPARRLYALGGTMFAALAVSSRSPSGRAGPSFLIPLAIASVAYLLAVSEFLQPQRYPRHVIFACLALAVLWRVPFLLKPPASQDDVRRYVWDGRVQRLGYNPYTAIPADPALAALHTAQTRELNNPSLPSPYPAGAQLFFRGVSAIHESTFAFKVAFVACDLAIILVLFSVLRRAGQAEHWVLAYAWHPLLATDVAGSGHIDIVGALLLLLSVAALGRRWRMTSAIAFGLAVAVKFLPIVLTPLYWRRVRVRDGLMAIVVAGMLYVPFLEHGRIPIGSLGIYVQRFRFNDPIFATLERVMGPYFAAGFAVLAGLVTAAWLRNKHPSWSSDDWVWPMAVSLACAPVVFPWYLLWLVPFLRSLQTVPLIVWSVTILSTYFVWYLHALGRPWQLPGWIPLFEYGLVATAATFILVRKSARPAMPVTEVD
jgi:alpha-1,6-mannosyltransferase